MEKSKKNIVLVSIIIIFLVLVAVLSVSECRKFEKAGEGTATDTVIVVKVDTLTIVKTDTIERIRPIPVKETIIDTMWIDKGSENPSFLPLTQRYYKDDGYELWISGYEPVLDRIKLYPKTVYKYQTVEKTNTIYRKTGGLYLSTTLWYNKYFTVPTIELEYYTRGRFGFNAGLGLCDRHLIFGAGIKYQIK